MADVVRLTELIEPEVKAEGLELVRVMMIGGKDDHELSVESGINVAQAMIDEKLTSPPIAITALLFPVLVATAHAWAPADARA